MYLQNFKTIYFVIYCSHYIPYNFDIILLFVMFRLQQQAIPSIEEIDDQDFVDLIKLPVENMRSIKYVIFKAF